MGLVNDMRACNMGSLMGFLVGGLGDLEIY